MYDSYHTHSTSLPVGDYFLYFIIIKDETLCRILNSSKINRLYLDKK